MKKKKINIPIFDIDVCIYEGDQEKISERLEKEYGSAFNPERIAYSYASSLHLSNNGNHKFIMCLPKKCEISMLCHECSHITFFILEFVGIELSGSNEIFCYLQQYLFNKLRGKNER